MKYTEWLQSLLSKHDERYYEHVVAFAQDIVRDLEQYKQHIVQKRLNIRHAYTLSILKPLIKVIACKKK